MISSPCRQCDKKYQSKDECIDTCRKLAEIRRMQFSRREISVCQAVDYADDNRFLIGHVESRRHTTPAVL
jgi:hypothetical protein